MLITYLASARAVIELCRSLGVQIVQLHGEMAAGALRRLRALDPGLTVVKSLVVGLHPMAVLEQMVGALSPYVDGLITDTFAPETGAAGATGRTHDWSVSRRLVELSERPVLLAGGLTAENVRRAILEVRLAGVDVHTGVENAAGRKSRDKTRSIGRGTRPSGVAPRHYRGRTRHRVTPGSPLPGQKSLKRSSGFRADTSFRRHVRFTCAILPWRLRRAPMSLGSPSSEGRRW